MTGDVDVSDVIQTSVSFCLNFVISLGVIDRSLVET